MVVHGGEHAAVREITPVQCGFYSTACQPLQRLYVAVQGQTRRGGQMRENEVWFIKQACPLSEDHRWYLSDCTNLPGVQDLAVGLYILNRMLKIKERLRQPELPVSLHVFPWATPCAMGSSDAVSCSTQPSASWRIHLLLALWLNHIGRTCVSQISLQPLGYDYVLSLTRSSKGAHESVQFWFCSFWHFYTAKINNLLPIKWNQKISCINFWMLAQCV